jgi:CRISPR-associated protein Cas5h
MMKIIAFDVRGDYAHFKKVFTNSSPLTYSTITPTALYGLIGAILGLDNDNNDYLNVINAETVSVGVRHLTPTEKTNICTNFINTKQKSEIHKFKNHTQIITEYLYNYSARVYVSFRDDELAKKFRDMVAEHKSVYTICLGLSECLADFKYVGEYDAEKLENELVKTGCVIPIDSIVFDKETNFFKYEFIKEERLPINMKASREVTKYANMLVEKKARMVDLKVKEAWKLPTDEVVVFYNGVA